MKILSIYKFASYNKRKRKKKPKKLFLLKMMTWLFRAISTFIYKIMKSLQSN